MTLVVLKAQHLLQGHTQDAGNNVKGKKETKESKIGKFCKKEINTRL